MSINTVQSSQYKKIITRLCKNVGHSGKEDCRLRVPSLKENAVKLQSDYRLSSGLFISKLLLNFLNELQDIIRIPICEASVTKLRSQRRRPVPRKWKCHSHPVSVCELALFLVPVCLRVWLLAVRIRHLINTNLGLNQIWEATGRYSVLVSDSAREVSQYRILRLCKYVETQRHSLVICSTLHWVSVRKLPPSGGSRFADEQQQHLCSVPVLQDTYFHSGWRVGTNDWKLRKLGVPKYHIFSKPALL